jgi:hypothetical protein
MEWYCEVGWKTWRCGAVWWDRMAAVGWGADGCYDRGEHRGGLGWAGLGWAGPQHSGLPLAL